MVVAVVRCETEGIRLWRLRCGGSDHEGEPEGFAAEGDWCEVDGGCTKDVVIVADWIRNSSFDVGDLHCG